MFSSNLFYKYFYNLNSIDKYGRTKLHKACIENNYSLLKVIISKKEILKRTCLIADYTGMSSRAEKNEIANDVNEIWINYDIVIYTPVITMGINFDIPDYFDVIFLNADCNTCPVREVMQQLMRVRHINDKELHYYLQCNKYDKENRHTTLSELNIFFERKAQIDTKFAKSYGVFFL